ncbi:DBF4-type zinc finger-containing protein 2 isoform X2 [Erpetoichthys calabaricus]|uniref:DBF4-type zinc finger-containing protein 2 isoform X2 n=1 Tax=Erpetoichthys calabaricus TaxID=27687 RepID=UPI0022340724|nr:DBF4-type zinc finger-containing protein 2 isoform X2 [Erpetoichthys calabaricus]
MWTFWPGTEQRHIELTARQDQSSGISFGDHQAAPRTSSAQTWQGYCSCCQVLYCSLEQHILGSRHRETISSGRSNVSTSGLMERFLQDVMHHHPSRYKDSRPTHADLPSLSSPLMPKEDLSDIVLVSEADQETMATREEMPSTDDESTEQPEPKERRPPPGHVPSTRLPAASRAQPAPSVPGAGLHSTTFKGNSPTQGFLHRTSIRARSPLTRHHVPCTSQMAGTGPCVPCDSGVQVKRGAAEEADSSGAQGVARLVAQAHLREVRTEDTVQGKGDTIGETIEKVIQEYCYGVAQEEEGAFHFVLNSLTKPGNFSISGSSTEWDVPVKFDTEPPKSEVLDLEALKEVRVNLEDKLYESQLYSVLHLPPQSKEESVDAVKEEILPPLPHIPPSFVGKTWSQVMYEDDLKIEALVREFRSGHFRCYFQSDSRSDYKEEPHTSGKALSDAGDAHATDDHNSSVFLPVSQPEPAKRPAKRKWRMASRCQVVKVSHSTQTSVLSYPVLKRRVTRKDTGHVADETPEVKTRLCALKLPEAYNKIMSPLQPKTLVYVLSSPDRAACPAKPPDSLKTRRKRRSVDSESAVRYKYKKTPLKYYDPLTNRILKSLPKGLVLCKAKKPAHVRQLFRSLSPDTNKEPRESDGSSKGKANSSSGLCGTMGSSARSASLSERGSSTSALADRFPLCPLTLPTSCATGPFNLSPVTTSYRNARPERPSEEEEGVRKKDQQTDGVGHKRVQARKAGRTCVTSAESPGEARAAARSTRRCPRLRSSPPTSLRPRPRQPAAESCQRRQSPRVKSGLTLRSSLRPRGRVTRSARR